MQKHFVTDVTSLHILFSSEGSTHNGVEFHSPLRSVDAEVHFLTSKTRQRCWYKDAHIETYCFLFCWIRFWLLLKHKITHKLTLHTAVNQTLNVNSCLAL